MANPLIFQGTLNKLRGSASVIDHPELNVTAPYLAEEGISLAFEGDASGYLGTMTGAVPSPNPYQMCMLHLRMLKTQFLGNLWKLQLETTTSIGDVVVNTDTPTLDTYYLTNCTIRTVEELNFAGRSPEFSLSIKGTYYINSSLFNI